MIFSTYSYDDRKYTYYDGPGVPPATGSFRRPGAAMLPESLLARLPVGAQRVGEGTMPKGVICTTSGAMAGLGATSDERSAFLWSMGAVLLAGYCLGRAAASFR